MDVTKRLAECGKILGIDVLDHVIVNARLGIIV
ncbi:JAB domain-containing protein [Niallia sp. XMNu-256]